MAEAPASIRVEVTYAEPGLVWSRYVTLPAGASVAEAVARSGFATARPNVPMADDCVGIFGRRVKPEHRLRDGDRVEVYRPLLLDPMEARRRRARPRG